MIKKPLRQATALLCAVLLLFSGGSPFAQKPAAAASMYQTALDHLVEWGIARGYSDGDLKPDNPITRAEFVAMVNRAYGYNEAGPVRFQDVPSTAWYADDIAIAYNAGCFSGTSDTTAAPNDNLTREQAMVLLARNMRLDAVPGEVTEFNDGNDFSAFSKGYVKAAVQQGLVSGYPDGTFRPKNRITRGEMAQLLYNALGTLVNEPGEHTLAGVFGNLTINCPNTTLRNTTVAGNLYISGGLGLGAVTLENVRVLGRIIVAGGGESETGENSVVLRNVEADELRVDTLSNQYVSLSAEGDTLIQQAIIRSDSYIQDLTHTDYGLLKISLEGESGARYSLSGNLKDVFNRAPSSTLNIAQGTAKNLTIDEKAAGSKLTLGTNATVKTLNLDVGVPIDGSGDVETLNVNSNGTTTTMLPDKIVIRPDVNATIAGEKMDTAVGQESSADPRLLAGYPRAGDVAPTSFVGSFSGNKSGTVYWAVSSITDGSVGEDELYSPASYGSTAIKSGNVKLTASNTPVTAKVTGLTSGGSYYLSAMLVDARDARSPVKVISFTAPDDTTPAFATGYPNMSKIENTSAQAAVMATKSCRLYYAFLPKGSTAPKPADFKSSSISGNLGYGSVDLTKNVPAYVKTTQLKETTTYDLYLWLSDVDGAKSSAVKKITFTTVDRTPPIFQTGLTVNSVKATSLGFLCTLNENGTVYWAAVKAGTEYPKPPAGSGSDAKVDPKSDYAKLQVASGMNALKSGKVNAKANKNATFNISGLEAETAYDIYYVAMDSAGNYTESIYMLTANTLDNIAPKATQEFTRYSGTNKTAPFADTDVRIIFSEGVQRASTNEPLLTLYKAVADAGSDASKKNAAKEALAKALRNTIKLYNVTGSSQPILVNERTASNNTSDDWVIDYRNAKVELTGGKLIVTFPTAANSAESALRLSSGSTYYFQLEDIADTSSAKNIMGITKMDRFTTISAQAALQAINQTTCGTDDTGKAIEADMAFSLTPLSTSKVEASIDWDMLIWSDTSANFELYRRTRVDKQIVEDWKKVGNEVFVTSPKNDFIGQSLGKDFQGLTSFPSLSTSLKEDTVYEYAIHFTKVDGSSERKTWSQKINFKVNVVTGSSVDLGNLAAEITDASYKEALKLGVTDIGTPENFNLRKQFVDSNAPAFTDDFPKFDPSDTYVDMTVLLSRPGTIYYVVAPVGTVTTKNESGATVEFDTVPKSGATTGEPAMPKLSQPGYLDIVSRNYSNKLIKTGSVSVGAGSVPITVDGLEPNTPYFVYFVIKGTGQVYSPVEVYGFKTTEVSRPVITLDLANPVVTIQSNMTADVDYILIQYTGNMAPSLSKKFKDVAKPEFADSADFSDSLTVLNAMATNVTGGSESIFDKYAQQTAKDSMSVYIRAATPTTGGDIVGKDSTSVLKGKYVSVDCSRMPMLSGTQYAFLAVGRGQGSGDAFRTIYPVVLPDNTPPKIVSVNTSALKVKQDTGTVQGTFTVTFDKEVYYADQSTSPPTLYHLDQGPILLTAGDKKRSKSYKSFGSMVDTGTDSMDLILNPANINKPTQTLTIRVRGNGSITFRSNLSDSYGQVQTMPLDISVASQKDANNVYQPVVTITRAWDGR